MNCHLFVDSSIERNIYASTFTLAFSIKVEIYNPEDCILILLGKTTNAKKRKKNRKMKMNETN